MNFLHIPGSGSFPLIKPLVGFQADIEARLSRFPYDRNVFLMMKYRPSNKALSDFMDEVLREKGFRGIRADHPDWNITANVYNPLAVLYCCKFGIALFDEPEPGQAYSANVAYELGIMHYQGKRCLILRHSSLPAPPFDLIKDLQTEYERDLQVRSVIREWVQQLAASAPDPAEQHQPDNYQAAEETPNAEVFPTEVAVSDPDRIGASRASLVVMQRTSVYWRLSWKVEIQNLTRGHSKFEIEVMYLDSRGHAIETQRYSTPSVGPNQVTQITDYHLLHRDLAERLAGATVRVTHA